MKKILLLICTLFTLSSIAQQAPEAGDYAMITSVKKESGSYIFKKSLEVYYGYNFSTNKVENKYKQNKKMVKELFSLIAKTDFSTIKGVDEAKVKDETEPNYFYILEFKKNNTVQRICWDSGLEEEKYKPLNDIATKMNSFW
ncbi:MAG: hypothetical protein SFY56_05695 [Bacteroidota bacterium]|nr:hypothetical protein [Bacteroidota bacterium]